MHKVRSWLANYWELNSLSLMGLIGLFAFLWFRLASITKGFSPSELAVHTQLESHTYTILYFWHHLLNAPYTFGLGLIEHFHLDGPLAIRSIGTFFGFLTVILFFYLTWRWFGNLVAVLATVIFADNFWFLLSTRDGTDISLYGLAVMLMVACGLIIRRKSHRNLNILGLVVITAVLIYIPGMIWFLALGAIFQRKHILEELKSLSAKYQLLLFIVFLVIVAPMLYSIYSTPSIAKQLIGLPMNSIGYHQKISNFIHYPLSLFINGSYLQGGSIGRLPLLDIFSDVMLALGIYWSFVAHRLDRTKLIAFGILLGWILSSLGGDVPTFVTMPFIFLLIAAGIAYLLKQWFSVFPRNPLARSTGTVLVCLAVASVAFYHYDQYFVAWPHTITTLQTYSRLY
ncbi:MAG TPA: hypothetical protein VMR34_02855 [Candidatus Saccharimonadales bacterium]|nr:hypothetical protein [Candidatus Saccharimonadales bacterium]